MLVVRVSEELAKFLTNILTSLPLPARIVEGKVVFQDPAAAKMMMDAQAAFASAKPEEPEGK